MAEIRVAGNLIEFVSLAHVGHLQVVFVDGALQVENEVQAPTSVFFGNWVYPLLRDHTDPENTSNYDVSGEYAFTTLDLGDRSAENVWSILKQVRDDFVSRGADIDYDIGKNSNSYVNSLLSVVGINVSDYLANATPTDVSRFPGAAVNVLDIEGDAFFLDLDGTTDNDIFRTGIEDDTIEGKSGNDTIDGNAGTDVCIFSGDCLEYDIQRDTSGAVFISHVRGSMSDGTDKLIGMEIARFSDGHEIDLTLDTLFGCTSLSFIRDFVTGTTQDTQVVLDIERLGDTSYPIRVFVDGEVTSGNAIFNDFFYTLDPGTTPELVITASVSEVFGDVAANLAISIRVEDPLHPFVEIEDGDASILLIGDQVDTRGGTTFGDPHLITFDNLAYDFQAAGDFILARATSGPAYEVQARFSPLSSAVSVAHAMATTIGGVSVSVEVGGVDGVLRIAGDVTALDDGGSLSVGSGTVSRDGQRFIMDHGNGDLTTVDAFSTFLNITPSPSLSRAPGSLEGLLGDANGNPANDLQLADGTFLSTPVSAQTLYSAYASSWLVPTEQSILPGASQPFDAPDRIVTVDNLPTSLRLSAEAAVDAANITNPILREAAILDFALTGDSEFIEAAARIDESLDPIVATVPVDPVSDPVVILTADRTMLNEEDAGGRSAVLTVSRGTSEGNLTLGYSITGADLGSVDRSDFIDEIVSGQVVIADGAETATFEIKIADDATPEGPESFNVKIALEESQASNYEMLVSSVRMTVEDHDEVPTLNDIWGTEGRDNLIGSEAPDAIRSLAGSYDRMSGGPGADQFIFGAETHNGIRERDVILDYQIDIDSILLEEDAHVGAVRQTPDGVVVFLEGDNDAIYVNGPNVTTENVIIIGDTLWGTSDLLAFA